MSRKTAFLLLLALALLAGCATFDTPPPDTGEGEVPPTPEITPEETGDADREAEPPAASETISESPVSEDKCPPSPEPPVIAPQCPEPKRCPVCPAVLVNEKPVLGEVERVTLKPQGFVYKARIDTGAEGTSIHAEDIVRFERDGDRWVRFKLLNPTSGELEELEQEVVRRVRIKQTELDTMERRLVVSMTLSIGGITQQVDVSLTDRSHMEFDMLIGRNFLRNLFVVDVSQRNLQ